MPESAGSSRRLAVLALLSEADFVGGCINTADFVSGHIASGRAARHQVELHGTGQSKPASAFEQLRLLEWQVIARIGQRGGPDQKAPPIFQSSVQPSPNYSNALTKFRPNCLTFLPVNMASCFQFWIPLVYWAVTSWSGSPTRRKCNIGEEAKEKKSLPTAPAAWTTETLLDILNRQPQPVTRFNPQGRILFANAAYAQLFGQTPAKMIGRNIRDFIPRYEWANVRKHLASLTRARANGLHENIVRTGKSADKSSRLLWFNTALFDIKGALIGFQSCAHHITELRNVERRLEHSYSLLYRIIDSIADPIFVKDSKRRMVIVNRAECALTGYPRDLVLGRTDDGFFPPKQVADFRQRDLQVLRTGRPNVNEEQITDARGNVHTLITKKSLLKGPNGERMIVGVIRDVTDLKRTEKSLRAGGTVSHIARESCRRRLSQQFGWSYRTGQ